MKYILFFIMLSYSGYSQKYFEQSYSSSTLPSLVIENFRGNIKVNRSASEKIKVVAEAQGEITEQTLKLEEFTNNNVIYLGIQHPCRKQVTDFDPEDPFGHNRYIENCEWDGEENSFPHLDFTIEIPEGIDLYVATVMDGSIEINDASGIVYANNVNGSIEMQNVAKVKNATTVNGNIDIYYNANPAIKGTYKTINGEINLNVPADASVTTNFKSFMGELFTDLEAVEVKENKQIKKKVERGKMTKIKEYSIAKIGEGKTDMFIETFNGNAYLIKNKK